MDPSSPISKANSKFLFTYAFGHSNSQDTNLFWKFAYNLYHDQFQDLCFDFNYDFADYFLYYEIIYIGFWVMFEANSAIK